MSTLTSADRPSSVGDASAPARKRTKIGKMSSTIKKTRKRRNRGKRPESGVQGIDVVDTDTDKVQFYSRLCQYLRKSEARTKPMLYGI